MREFVPHLYSFQRNLSQDNVRNVELCSTYKNYIWGMQIRFILEDGWICCQYFQILVSHNPFAQICPEGCKLLKMLLKNNVTNVKLCSWYENYFEVNFFLRIEELYIAWIRKLTKQIWDFLEKSSCPCFLMNCQHNAESLDYMLVENWYYYYKFFIHIINHYNYITSKFVMVLKSKLKIFWQTSLSSELRKIIISDKYLQAYVQ